jgi:hypothetical protein
MTRLPLAVITSLLTFALSACSSTPKADFVVTTKPIGQPIAGFGACMNPYLYAYPNTPQEINPTQMADLEAKVKQVHPQFVRVFFLNSWMEKDTDNSIAKNHPGMRESLIKTVRLAQDAGATVLLQLWYDPDRYQDVDGVAKRFAKHIAELRNEHGLTCIRYATIQNEPDEHFDDDITVGRYMQVYRSFDHALRDLKLRDQIKIVGGDLVGEYPHHWLPLMGERIADVLDGYSIHCYWEYWNIRPMRQRLKDVATILDSMPAKQRRPLYVTEFGTQGFRPNFQVEPGTSNDGKPLAEVPVSSFEIAIFMLDAINLGYVGTAQWDLYEVWYDRKMGYGVIGSVEKGFPEKPGYHLLSFFTHGVEPGWRAMKIDGEIEDVWVAGLRGKSRDQLGVFVLNRLKGLKQVTVGGLPPGKPLHARIWNRDSKGTTHELDPVTPDKHGVAAVAVPHEAVVLLSSN